MDRFLGDGAPDSRELQQLEALRRTLGISLFEHRRLLDERDLPEPLPTDLALELDESTLAHFAAGARCLLRLRLGNRGELAWQKVVVTARLSGHGDLEAVELVDVFPGEPVVAKLFLTPELSGFYALEGEIVTTDLAGTLREYRFEEVQFRVVGGDGPQVQVVHIDQRSARVVDNSRSQFGGTTEAGGLVGEGRWVAVVVEPVARVEAASEEEAPVRAAAGSGPFTLRAEGLEVRAHGAVAQGDLATVYAGEITSGEGRGEKVALKVADDPADGDLLGREARVLRLFEENPAAQSKHLPRLLAQFSTVDGRPGSVLTWLEGKDFHSIRERYPEGLPSEPATWIFRRTLSALGYAHSLGVVHGNITPAHILVSAEDHNIFLVDWCFAAVRPAETGDGFVFLDEVYSPPEVSERRPPLPSSDLFSLARSIVYLLGGDPESETLPQTIEEPFERLLRYFLRKSALQRPQDAWQMYEELDILRRELFGEHRFREFEL